MSEIKIVMRPSSDRAVAYWVVDQTGEFEYQPVHGPYDTYAAAEPRRQQVMAERGQWHDPKTLRRLRRRQVAIARTLANLRGLASGTLTDRMAKEFADIENERANIRLHRMKCKGCSPLSPMVTP